MYMVTQKPTVLQFFTFAPMFFTSYHMLCAVCPIVFQRYRYNKIYKDYMKLWPLEVADQQGLKEIKYLFIKGLCTVIFYSFMGCVASFAYLPLRGLDFDKSIWPAIAALKLLKDGPQSIIYFVAITNFALVFAKAYGMAVYARYQNRIKRELKECIKLDIKLRRFSNSLILYFKWVVLMHVGNAIIILSMLYYVNLFMNGGYDPLSSRLYVVAANMMAFIFVYFSEVYFEQTELKRNVLCETPWHTFDMKNKKLLLIYLSNLTRSQFISAGGMFDLNYSLLILVMHKTFNVLTILKQMSPDGI